MTDLMRALLSILVAGAVGKPYNVGSESAISIAELANCVDRVVGDAASSSRGLFPLRQIATTRHGRLRRIWFHTEVSLETAIARTAAWYRASIAESVAS